MKIGKVSESILKRSVLRQIKTKRYEVVNGAALGGDCAIFALAKDTGFASCMKEGDLSFFPVSHLIIKCANNLAAAGAEPFAIMLTLLLPESLEEPQLKEIMKEAEETCASLKMQIAGGQTSVIKSVNNPMAVVTGYGKIVEGKEYSAKNAKAGQDIVLSKWTGLEGTAYLAKKNKEFLAKRYPLYFVETAAEFDQYLSVVPEAQIAIKSGVCAMHDVSEGGIFSALWELCEGADVGLDIDLKRIPLRQETVEVCEHLGKNPYELISGGCLIMTTEDGPGLVEALERQGIFSAMIGKLTDSNDRIIRNEEEVRYMDRPKQDELFKEEN